jgi:hypothetical protein
MYHTTGFSRDDIIELCTRIHQVVECSGDAVRWPPILGLYNSVWVTLTYLRRNHVQAELGEYFGVSQSSVSRAITVLTPLLVTVTAGFVPTAEDLSSNEQYILDGTLVSCWSWHAHPELYSGKHHTTGLNLQVACTLRGELAWISDPVAGRRHDSAAMILSGVLDTLDPRNWIGDRGYVGHNMITPIKKRPHSDLTESQNDFNTAVNGIRWKIERTIAHLKTWRILHTDYRRPLNTFPDTIAAVIGLQFYRAS